MNTLRAEQLVKRYRRREVVRNVSLEVARGEVVGLLGPNGAGKPRPLHDRGPGTRRWRKDFHQ